MATALSNYTPVPLPQSPTAKPARTALVLVPPYEPVQEAAQDPYAILKRRVAGGADRVHPIAIQLAALAYASMLVIFWLAFGTARDGGLVLAVITVLMTVYFGLIFGGILLSDTPVAGEERSFAAFLDGEVATATGPIPGRVALIMIAGLPATLACMALVIGIIAHLPLA